MHRDNLTKDELYLFRAMTPDEKIYKEIKAIWDNLSKPIDGFGEFEDILCRIGAIQGKRDFSISKRCAVIFCADNGVTAEGISQTGKEVTLQVARMLGKGESSANTLGCAVKCDCLPVDIGIDFEGDIPGVTDFKIRRGTENFVKEKALTEEDVLKAIGTGIDIAESLKNSGLDLILTGEMGIGNTTTASALFCLITGDEPEMIVGRGAGLSDEGLKRKVSVVKKAVDLYGNKEFDDDRKRALYLLSCIGGLDIAALCGLFIGGSIYGIPVVIDGLITAVAALLAEMLLPCCNKIMLPSHAGREKGVERALKILGLKPLINGNMALGESTGAMMLLPVLDAAFSFYENAKTFKDGNIEEYQRLS